VILHMSDAAAGRDVDCQSFGGTYYPYLSMHSFQKDLGKGLATTITHSDESQQFCDSLKSACASKKKQLKKYP